MVKKKSYLDFDDDDDDSIEIQESICDVCYESFDTEEEMKKHKKKKHFCKICKEHYENLRVHNKSEHSEPDKEKDICDICNKSYADVIAHKKRVHSEKSNVDESNNAEEIQIIKNELIELRNLIINLPAQSQEVKIIEKIVEKVVVKAFEIPTAHKLIDELETLLGIKSSNWKHKHSLEKLKKQYIKAYGEDKYTENYDKIAFYCRLKRSKTHIEDLILYLNEKMIKLADEQNKQKEKKGK